MFIQYKLFRGLLLFIAALYLHISFATGQQLDPGDDAAAQRIEADIRLLASDSLIGRETGTPGEWMARKYIERKFKEIGLEPLFDTSYFESFKISATDFVDQGTSCVINNNALMLYNGYYPLGFSANDTVSGQIIYAGNGIYCENEGINDYRSREDVKGKIILMDLAIPDKMNKNKTIWDSAQKIIRVKDRKSVV